VSVLPPSRPPVAPDPEPETLAGLADRVRSAVARRADCFEVRAEASESIEYTWSRGGLQGAGTSRLSGVAVRLWVKGRSGFASCHTTDAAAIERMIDQALSIAGASASSEASSFPHAPLPARKIRYRPSIHGNPFEASPEEVGSLLGRAEGAALAVNPTLQVRALLAASRRHVVYADSGGRETDSETLLATLLTHAIHRNASRPGDGQDWIAGERGLRDFGADGPERIGKHAAVTAIESSTAIAAPAGRHRVLCDNALSGVLAHESFGHLTEYDLIAMRWSRLHGCLGQRFASEAVSVVDAPIVEASPRDGIRVPVDEEGVEGRPIRVLDKGVLRHWMHARGSAQLEGHEPTGNGRAMNARWSPIVRMRNTYFEPGDLTVEEALETMRDGVYLIGGRGGAPSAGGEFMFTSVRGYLVKGGRIDAPLRATAISGNIFDFLKGVRGVTRDFQVSATNFGGCGKWGQSYLAVGMGGPHVLVEDAQLGGVA